MSIFRRYLVVFFLLTAGLALLVACFIFSVDPFGFYHGKRIKGFNELKTEMAKHESLAKAYNVRAFKPMGLLLGSSRSNFGLDPDHPGWPPSARPVYNLSISGGRIYETMRYFQHALQASTIKHALLSLDMLMFGRNEALAPGFTEQRLLSSPKGQPKAVGKAELWRMLLSFDALNAARHTVGRQNDLTAQVYQENGLTRWRDKAAWLSSKESHHVQFGYMEKMFATTVWRPDTEKRWKFDDPKDPQPAMEHLRQIIKLAYAKGVDLRIIISPAHARISEVIIGALLGQQWEHWKRRLVEMLAAEARSANAKPFPLFDFSGYNSITTESFPAPGSDQSMRWYWDGSHYKKEAGDLALDRVFGHADQSRRIPDDFGTLLTEDNIESHLAQQRLKREAFAKSRPNDVREAQSHGGAKPM